MYKDSLQHPSLMTDKLLSVVYRVFPYLFCFFCITFFLFLSFSIIEVYSIKKMVHFSNEVFLFE